MKIFFILLIALIIPILSQAQPAAPRDFGIGIAIGNPTAITGKVWLSSASALDFGLAYSSRDYTLVYGDYLLHSTGLFGSNRLVFRWALNGHPTNPHWVFLQN